MSLSFLSAPNDRGLGQTKEVGKALHVKRRIDADEKSHVQLLKKGDAHMCGDIDILCLQG